MFLRFFACAVKTFLNFPCNTSIAFWGRDAVSSSFIFKYPRKVSAMDSDGLFSVVGLNSDAKRFLEDGFVVFGEFVADK